MEIIWKSLGNALFAYFRWEIVLTLFIGGAALFLFQFLLGWAMQKNPQIASIGCLTYSIIGPVFQVLVMALVITVIMPYAIGYAPDWAQYNEVFSNFGVVFLAGVAGLLFSLLISLIPLVGQLLNGPSATNLFIAIPIIIALLYGGDFGKSFSSILPFIFTNKLAFFIALFLGWFSGMVGIFITVGLAWLINAIAKKDLEDMGTILALAISPIVSAMPIIFIINIVFYRYIYPMISK